LVLRQGLFELAPPTGLEPVTYGLTVHVPLQISQKHPIWLLTSSDAAFNNLMSPIRGKTKSKSLTY
ncbi:hypothetical protein, partial [Aeromonas veronii]|uniref:hypothetical protein n=1 Tax=Aeromonas veronii TaxID=654 RepID=UPI00197B421E